MQQDQRWLSQAMLSEYMFIDLFIFTASTSIFIKHEHNFRSAFYFHMNRAPYD